MSGEVVAVNLSPSHTMAKQTQTRIHLLAGLGVEGDVHAGEKVRHRYHVRKNPDRPNLCQVHLIQAELHDELRAAGFDLSYGQMGENVTTRGIDLLGLPTGTRLRLGSSAVIEVTGLRTPCHQLDGIQQGLMAATREKVGQKVCFKAGIMGIVVEDGEVQPGDMIGVDMPPEPARALEATVTRHSPVRCVMHVAGRRRCSRSALELNRLGVLGHESLDRLGHHPVEEAERATLPSGNDLVFRFGHQLDQRIHRHLRVVGRRDRNRLLAGVVAGVLEELRLMGHRHHRTYPNVLHLLLVQFLAKRITQPDDAELGGRVRGVQRGGNLPDDRGDVDERPTPTLSKVLHGEVAAVGRAEQVGLDDLLVIFERNLVVPPDHGDAGVVDPHVEPPEGVDRLLGEVFHRLPVADIGGHGQGFATCRDTLLGDSVERRNASGRDDDGGTTPGQFEGRASSEAARRTGDDNYLAAVLIIAGHEVVPLGEKWARRVWQMWCRAVLAPE